MGGRHWRSVGVSDYADKSAIIQLTSEAGGHYNPQRCRTPRCYLNRRSQVGYRVPVFVLSACVRACVRAWCVYVCVVCTCVICVALCLYACICACVRVCVHIVSTLSGCVCLCVSVYVVAGEINKLVT